MTMLRKAPLAWSKASSMDVIPTLRLSHSMPSASSSRVKSVDAKSCRFVHQSRGLLHVGESLPTDVRAKDDSSPVLSAANPSRRDVPVEGPPPAMEGISGVDVDLFATTTTNKDPLAVSPSV